MNNIQKYEEFLDSDESGNLKESSRYYNYGRQTKDILTNLEDFGKKKKSFGYSSDDSGEIAAIKRTFGRAISKVANLGRRIRGDFNFDSIKGYYKDSDFENLDNVRTLVDKWEERNLASSGKVYTDRDFTNLYRELESKGKRTFGNDFKMFEPKGREQEIWMEFAAEILERSSSRMTIR